MISLSRSTHLSPTLEPPSPSGTINSEPSSSSDTDGACTRALGTATAAAEPGLEEEASPPASGEEAPITLPSPLKGPATEPGNHFAGQVHLELVVVSLLKHFEGSSVLIVTDAGDPIP